MKVDESIKEPENPPQCDHHYVSIHQSDFPSELYWIRQCSLCRRIDGEDLARSLSDAEAALFREKDEYDLQ
jgi:hypothetical protein